jgi:hypothetical protein
MDIRIVLEPLMPTSLSLHDQKGQNKDIVDYVIPCFPRSGVKHEGMAGRRQGVGHHDTLRQSRWNVGASLSYL